MEFSHFTEEFIPSNHWNDEQWYKLGLKLGLGHDELTKIELRRKYVHECTKEVLFMWRMNAPNENYQSILINAMRSIGMNDFADYLIQREFIYAYENIHLDLHYNCISCYHQ